MARGEERDLSGLDPDGLPAARDALVALLESLDADAVRRWSRTAVESLDAHRAELALFSVLFTDGMRAAICDLVQA